MNSSRLVFLALLLLAIVLRFYKLGSLPSGLTWDEAAIGYNAYGLVVNHRDEWLHRTPIVFQSFGDYKSPLLIYLTTIPVAIFSLTPFAVRLPIALAGTGLVVVSFFLARELRKIYRLPFDYFPHFVMFLVAISPWAIHYSRLAFESMLAAFLISFGVFCWLKGIEKGRWLIIGDIAFALSLYAYHSAKVVVPILVVLLSVAFYKKYLTHKKEVLVGTVLAMLTLLPLGYATVFGKANSRALSTTILNSPNAVTLFASHIATQLSPGFLLQGEDLTYRQSTEQMGVLYHLELILMLIGAGVIVRTKRYRSLWWIPSLFIVGMIPAALGIDVPHSNRALLALPWGQLTTAFGLIALMAWIRNRKVRAGTWILVVIICLYSLVHYVQTYTHVYSTSVALTDFGYGYDEAVAFARSKESEVNKVYITNHYGQAYIYLLFFKRLSPMDYRGGGLANYVISDRPFEDAKGQAHSLIIGTPDEVPATVNVIREIKYPDGKVAFRIAQQ